jgi:hypothetical protein
MGENVTRIVKMMETKYPRTFKVKEKILNVIEDISSGYKPLKQLMAVRGMGRS